MSADRSSPRPGGRLRGWKIIGAGLAFLLLVAIFLPPRTSIAWDGFTDLDVEFVISDADTGRPVAGAAVDIEQEAGGFCRDRDAKQFRLVTGPDGTATHRCLDCMCSGTTRMKDSFAVHLPYWTFAVSADGYRPSEPVELDQPLYERQVERRQGSARLRVPVTIKQRGVGPG
jgi:hypothetical protein